MLKTYTTKLFNWRNLFIVSFIGVLIMIISTYTEDVTNARANHPWKEYLIFWFYFTLWSNLSALIVSAVVTFRKTVTINNPLIQKFKIMMVVNLVITLIIYWAVLAPTALPKLSAFSIFSTCLIHAVTPVFAVAVFITEVLTNSYLKKEPILKTTLFNMSFPLIWLTIAVIIYFALGADKESSIYGFIDFKGSPTQAAIYIPTVAIAYPSLTALISLWFNKIKR